MNLQIGVQHLCRIKSCSVPDFNNDLTKENIREIAQKINCSVAELTFWSLESEDINLGSIQPFNIK